MRLKLYIPELGKVINIDKIEPKSGKNPGIFFRCHKKYEWTIFGSKVIFIDKHYREYFRSSWVKTNWRPYETDAHDNRVIFEVRAPEYENYGKISQRFLRKQIKKVCNMDRTRRPKPPPISSVIIETSSQSFDIRYSKPSWWPKCPRQNFRNIKRKFTYPIKTNQKEILKESRIKSSKTKDKSEANLSENNIKIRTKPPP